MSLIETFTDQNIFKIILNRPEKLNSLSKDLLEELYNIFDSLKNNTSIRVIVISGKGKSFCAGADINFLSECDAVSGYNFAKHGQDVMNKITNINKPVIAAIHGIAFGGGCELAMAANIRIATKSAKFAQPEIKLGIMPGFAGTQRLARYIGKGRAMDLCLTGRVIDSQTALSWGLISEIVEDHLLQERADLLARDLALLPPLAFKSIIKVLEEGYDLPLSSAQDLEASHFAMLCATSDKFLGVQAFLNKTKPVFEGK